MTVRSDVGRSIIAGFGALVLWVAAVTPLASQARQARQGLLSLEDGLIFYEVLGAGEPVVVIHGGPGLDHNYLRPGLDVLATGRAVVYYDQRGTGRSEADLDESGINLDAFVDDIDQLRQGLEYDRITILAHSFGGLIGMQYALRHPENTRALILMNSVEPGSRWREETRSRQVAAQTTEDSLEVAELMASAGFRQRAAPVMSQLYRVSFRSTLRSRDRIDALNLELSGRTSRNGQDVARLLGASMGVIDWWGDLPRLDVPTLIIHGRHDASPVAMAEAMAEAMPQAELAVLNTGHFPYVEDPTALLQVVSNFLAGLGR
jgi:proline iminopeptidase